MDSDNPTGLVLSIAILIAVLAACGILSLVVMVLLGAVTLAV